MEPHHKTHVMRRGRGGGGRRRSGSLRLQTPHLDVVNLQGRAARALLPCGQPRTLGIVELIDWTRRRRRKRREDRGGEGGRTAKRPSRGSSSNEWKVVGGRRCTFCTKRPTHLRWSWCRTTACHPHHRGSTLHTDTHREGWDTEHETNPARWSLTHNDSNTDAPPVPPTARLMMM